MPRKLFHWARLLHIYTSTALFALLVFFCLTGIFLNHPKMFSGQAEDGSRTLELPSVIVSELQRDSALNTQLLEDWIQKKFSTPTASAIEYDREMGEIILDYSLPAGYAQATVIVDDAEIIFDFRTGNSLSIWNDLHKGRHSGRAWSWLIDISAALMIFFALTGFVILFQGKKHRKEGLILAGFGLFTPLIIYFLFVPQISGV